MKILKNLKINEFNLNQHPGKKILPKSICVLPERVNYKKIDCLGICSDFIGKYK